MIQRSVEYIIRCDNEDCHDCNWFAFGCLTREDCAAEATKQGWMACTRKRWLCPRCAKKAQTPQPSPTL